MAVNQYNVSDALGNDTTGDGSPNNPFKTPNAAIAAGVTAGLADICLALDMAVAWVVYTVTVPDGIKVSIKTNENISLSGAKIDLLTIGNGSYVSVNNVKVDMVKEGAGAGARTLVAINSQIDAIKDAAGTGPAAQITGTFSGVFGGSTLLTDIGGMAFFEGTVIINNILTPLVGLDMNGGTITKCASVEGPAASEAGIEAGAGFGTYCKLGDNAGVTSHEIRDSDGVSIARINSDGDLEVDGDITPGGTVAGVDISAHASDPSAHHTRYSDTEADARVSAGIATHTALPSAHHTRYADSEAVSAMGTKASSNPLNHDRYTDTEADARVSTGIATHAALPDAHHSKSHAHNGSDGSGTVEGASIKSTTETTGKMLTANGSNAASWLTRYSRWRLTVWSTLGGTVADGVNTFTTIGGDPNTTLTEANTQIRMPKCRVNSISINFTGSGGEITLTVRKNGVATTLTGTTTGAGRYDFVGSGPVDFALNDLISLNIVNTSGSTSKTIRGICLCVDSEVI